MWIESFPFEFCTRSFELFCFPFKISNLCNALREILPHILLLLFVLFSSMICLFFPQLLHLHCADGVFDVM